MPPMAWPVLALILVGLAVSLPLTAMLLRLGQRANLLDSAGAAGHAKQLRRVPNIGGIAIYTGVVLPMIAGLLGFELVPAETLQGLAPGLNADLLARIAE